MAKIEQEFLNRPEPRTGNFKAPPFIPRIRNADLGFAKLDGERYFSPEFMQAEWDSIWTKTWQLVAREDEFSEPGAFYVHELGKESFLFVKGEDHEVRGFYNVCQHRGNRLCQADVGVMDTFTCPFHGWQWDSSGALKKVADPQFFRQFDAGVPTDELALPAVKVALWGGWLWFNMDVNACPLEEYLGEPGTHLETYEFEKFDLVDYQSFEWNGNWKHAVDAFNESYHFGELHPDMIEFGEGHDIPIELLGIHSRMLNFNRTVSEIVEDRDTMTKLREHMMMGRGRGDLPESGYTVPAKDVHLEEIQRRREIENDTYLPYKNMNDEQLVHQYHYTFFPNTTFTQTPEFGAVFRYRPHATDPGRCYYDFFIMVHTPPGTPEPDRPPHQTHRHADGIDYGQAFEGTFDPILANVLAQDGSNMVTMQAGVQSDSFKGMNLCEQELRLRHFHKTIDDFIAGTVSTQNLLPPDAYIEDE
jgi:phenylpropionate dioxygenase-like ring-hydroxylating dioxygenase large terminal subunit